MKFRMYAPVMFQNMNKTVGNIITFFLASAFFVTLGWGVYCCSLTAWESAVVCLSFELVVYGLFECFVGKPMSYIEVYEENIKVVRFFPFIKREKIFRFSQIEEAYIEAVYFKGRSLMPPQNRPYEIEFYDQNLKKMFTVEFSKESYDIFKDYIVNYDIYFKNNE